MVANLQDDLGELWSSKPLERAGITACQCWTVQSILSALKTTEKVRIEVPVFTWTA